MNELIKIVQKIDGTGMHSNVAMGLFRHLLTVGGGYFVSQGVMDNSQLESGIGAIITLVGIVWSVLVKMSVKEKPDINKSPLGMYAVLLCSLVMASGCATSANDVAMARIAADTAQAYYQQPNNATYMEFEGSNVTFCVSGASRLVFSGPIPTKSIYPREEGALSKTISGITDIAKVAGLTYVGGKLAAAPRSVEPKVVTTEKLVPVTGAAQ